MFISSNAIHDLLRKVSAGEITIREFHQRLEPELSCIAATTRDEDARFREYINRLELMIYTLPANDQPEAARKLAQEIREFICRGSP